jgi:hypothetical protein
MSAAAASIVAAAGPSNDEAGITPASFLSQLAKLMHDRRLGTTVGQNAGEIKARAQDP